MKNILCFGDSNTFGYRPVTGYRYDYNERWTGILQNLLGKEYYIIEEGLNGRTTCFEDPIEPNRNGKTALHICMGSHKPVDLVIICLGTNDLKTRFNLTVNDVARGMGALVKIIRKYDFGECYRRPQILIMSPIRIQSGVKNTFLDSFGKESVAKSNELPAAYKEIARIHNCCFFDAGSVAEASKEDYIHLTLESHKALAGALFTEVKKILK